MKIFIINLKNAIEKRKCMIERLEKAGITDYEFIEAVYGEDLSLEFIKNNVYDYPDCALTKGEIGCAFSHLKVYQKMLIEGLTSALILEDDIVFPSEFGALLEPLEKSISVDYSKIISLCKANKIYLGRNHFQYEGYTEYTAVTAFGGYGYVLNSLAAKSFLDQLLPIKYEADMFMHFRENGWLKEFNVLYPQCISIIEDHDLQSNIDAERKIKKRARHKYKKYVLLKRRPLWIKFKNRCKRIYWKIRQVRHLS